MRSRKWLQLDLANAMMAIMRYPKGHNDAVKRRIVEAAAKALRRHGLEGVSIPALMKQAGLTHGGFYTHFKNRDELVAEAIRFAGAETAERVFGKVTLEPSLRAYLSKAHVDHPEAGCVLAALGTDGARQPPRVKAAFSEVASGFLHLAEGPQDRGDQKATVTDAALVRAATMVGAVILSRLVRNAELSERILSACLKAVST